MGQTTQQFDFRPTLDMQGRKIINQAEGTDPTDGVTFSQLSSLGSGYDVTKAAWDGAQYVSSSTTTLTDTPTLITKNVITGNNTIESTLYGFIYIDRLEIWTDNNQTGTQLLVQNFTG